MTNAKKDELPPEAQENLQGLRELRMIFGLTQKKLAERVGLTESCIKAYENGYSLPTFEVNHVEKPPPRYRIFLANQF